MSNLSRGILGLLAFICGPFALFAQPTFETTAQAAIVIDHGTGQVLLAKQADIPLPPASMSKLMTINMVFEALEDGRLSLDTVLPVSPHASSYGGSTMFLDPRDRVSVEDLIRGVIVLSGNDASVVFAEALSPDGTEDGFSDLMTYRAKELGLTHSQFKNASGWPEPGHVMSVRDLARLAQRLIDVFPQYYGYYAETEFLFDGRAPANVRNRNPILRLAIGADGLKTGHTQDAGYGLVGSAVQDGRRVIFVITGIESEKARSIEAERIINWAFRQFAVREVISEGTEITQADVFLGSVKKVPLITADAVEMLVPVVGQDIIEAKVQYNGPLHPPLATGQEVGTLTLNVANMSPVMVPLIIPTDISKAGMLGRVQAAASVFIAKVLGGDA